MDKKLIERIALEVAEAMPKGFLWSEEWGHECHGEGRDDSEAFDCADAIRAMNDDKGGAA